MYLGVVFQNKRPIVSFQNLRWEEISSSQTFITIFCLFFLNNILFKIAVLWFMDPISRHSLLQVELPMRK